MAYGDFRMDGVKRVFYSAYCSACGARLAKFGHMSKPEAVALVADGEQQHGFCGGGAVVVYRSHRVEI